MESYTDYMLVLSPPKNVMDIIYFYKRDAAQKIGNYESMHSVPHISIDDYYRQKPFMADPAILKLAEKLKLMPGIKLGINGLDYFTHGMDIKTIYAKISATPTSEAWFKLLKKNLNIKKRVVPHITIARNIPQDTFNMLWRGYKQVKLVEPFVIDRLTVLRRDTFASFARWEIFIEIPFENKIIAEKIATTASLLKPVADNATKNQQISLF